MAEFGAALDALRHGASLSLDHLVDRVTALNKAGKKIAAPLGWRTSHRA